MDTASGHARINVKYYCAMWTMMIIVLSHIYIAENIFLGRRGGGGGGGIIADICNLPPQLSD